MNFLEELENNKKKEGEKTDAEPRKLWESCFKYFQHFTSIIKKEDRTFDSEFHLVFLDLKRDCEITGPYEIKRSQYDDELKLEIKMVTQLKKGIKINRKDKRSADLLKAKLARDAIMSAVRQEKDEFFIEINNKIPSIFSIVLKNNKGFTIHYKNICSSANRTIKLPMDKINEKHMDTLAKYILGQNPTLYTETISNQDITKIRQKIQLDKSRIEQVKAEALEKTKKEEIDKTEKKKQKFSSFFNFRKK